MLPDGLPEYRIRIADAFQFLFEPARYKGAFGGRGSGKSHSVAEALVAITSQHSRRVFCGREIQKSIADSSKQLIDDKIKAAGLPGFRSTETYIENNITDSMFLFGGLRSNPDSFKSAEGIDIIWLEEANRISQRSLDLIRPTLRGSPRLAVSEIWATWNPDSEFDAIDRLLRGKKLPPGAVVKRVSWRDNPFFPQVLRDEMEYDKSVDLDKHDHVWEGEYRKAHAGAYFKKELRAARDQGRVTGHIPLDPVLPIKTYWDLGVSDHTAIWVVQTVDDRINCLCYIEGQGQSLGYYINELRARGYGTSSEIILPHDGANEQLGAHNTKSVSDHFRDAGFRLVTVIKNQGKGAAMQRVEAARRIFPRVWFDGGECEGGLKALAGYHEKIDEARNIGLGPEHDVNSDGCLTADAIIKTKAGPTAIADVVVGDEVWTPRGWARVTAAGPVKMTEELLEVKTVNGAGLVGTPEHKILTHRGFATLDALRYTDRIFSGKEWQCVLISWFSRAANIGFREAITRRTSGARGLALYTGLFGKTPTAQSPKGGRFTIWTAINATIISTISKSFLGRIIGGCTPWNTTPAESCGLQPRMLLRWPHFGTPLLTGGHGMQPMAKKHGKIDRGLSAFALSVASGLCRLILRAPCTATKIASKTRIDLNGGSRLVFDLTVENHACYVANGLLVSNSDAFGLMCITHRDDKPEHSKPIKYSNRGIV